MRLGRKNILALVFIATSLIIIIGALFINLWLGVTFILFSLIGISILMLFLIANRIIKKTNWWKNNLLYTHQFVSNAGYRYNLERNYEIVNVGSNPARFAFIYDDVIGENWSTGTQGLDMDFEVLRYFHSYLKQGAIVLLPIVPFSSVSGYLEQFKTSRHYLAKFVSILDYLQVLHHEKLKRGNYYFYYPLFYNWRAIRYLIKDEKPDCRIEKNDQPMGLLQLKNDAQKWIAGWEKEFAIKTLDGQLPGHLEKGRKISVEIMRKMILFLKERGYNPVIVSPPMSEALTMYFTDDIKKAYIYSFVDEFRDMNVAYLDYTDSQFIDNKLYFNALYMNLKGRRLFTEQVLKDLNIKKKTVSIHELKRNENRHTDCTF